MRTELMQEAYMAADDRYGEAAGEIWRRKLDARRRRRREEEETQDGEDDPV